MLPSLMPFLVGKVGLPKHTHELCALRATCCSAISLALYVSQIKCDVIYEDLNTGTVSTLRVPTNHPIQGPVSRTLIRFAPQDPVKQSTSERNSFEI